MNDFFSVFLVGLVLFFAFDRFLRAVGIFSADATGRYLVLHVFCNAFVTMVHWKDVVAVYLRPSHAFDAETNVSGSAVIASLHVFHLVFCRPLPFVEWLHHLVMIVLMLPLAVALNPGHLLGHGAFFASGLPGGIDYFMLVLVKLNLISSLQEKSANSFIQTYLRAPFCCYHSLFVWINFVENKNVYVKPFLPVWAVAPAM
jgi:hypothetical protein